MGKRKRDTGRVWTSHDYQQAYHACAETPAVQQLGQTLALSLDGSSITERMAAFGAILWGMGLQAAADRPGGRPDGRPFTELNDAAKEALREGVALADRRGAPEMLVMAAAGNLIAAAFWITEATRRQAEVREAAAQAAALVPTGDAPAGDPA